MDQQFEYIFTVALIRLLQRQKTTIESRSKRRTNRKMNSNANSCLFEEEK